MRDVWKFRPSPLSTRWFSGQDATGVSGMVPTVVKQSFDVIKSATGVDMGQLVQEKAKIVGAGVDINQ